MHMVFDGLDPTVYPNFEVLVLFLQPDDVPFEDGDLISQVDFLVVEFLDGGAAVNRRLHPF